MWHFTLYYKTSLSLCNNFKLLTSYLNFHPLAVVSRDPHRIVDYIHSPVRRGFELQYFSGWFNISGSRQKAVSPYNTKSHIHRFGFAERSGGYQLGLPWLREFDWLIDWLIDWLSCICHLNKCQIQLFSTKLKKFRVLCLRSTSTIFITWVDHLFRFNYHLNS